MTKTCRFLSLAVAALMAGPASASLIGDEIQTRWQYQSFDVTKTYVVGPGVEGDPWQSSFQLDIGESSIAVDVMGQAIALAPGVVWTFSDLDWLDTPGEIVGVSASVNWGGWSDDFVSFGADYVRVNFLERVTFDTASDLFVLDLDVRHPSAAIPEPSAALVFAVGLIAVGWRADRTKKRSLSHAEADSGPGRPGGGHSGPCDWY